jgi:hypothetical protein
VSRAPAHGAGSCRLGGVCLPPEHTLLWAGPGLRPGGRERRPGPAAHGGRSSRAVHMAYQLVAVGVVDRGRVFDPRPGRDGRRPRRQQPGASRWGLGSATTTTRCRRERRPPGGRLRVGSCDHRGGDERPVSEGRPGRGVPPLGHRSAVFAVSGPVVPVKGHGHGRGVQAGELATCGTPGGAGQAHRLPVAKGAS